MTIEHIGGNPPVGWIKPSEKIYKDRGSGEKTPKELIYDEADEKENRKPADTDIVEISSEAREALKASLNGSKEKEEIDSNNDEWDETQSEINSRIR